MFDLVNTIYTIGTAFETALGTGLAGRIIWELIGKPGEIPRVRYCRKISKDFRESRFYIVHTSRYQKRDACALKFHVNNEDGNKPLNAKVDYAFSWDASITDDGQINGELLEFSPGSRAIVHVYYHTSNEIQDHITLGLANAECEEMNWWDRKIRFRHFLEWKESK